MGISNQASGLKPGVCTSTTRPSTPYEGMMIYETDTDLTYLYNGSSWQQISGGTAVGNSGLVYITSATFSPGSTMNINNCFTSTYRDYRIIADVYPVNTGDICFRLAVSGSANSTSNYYQLRILASNNSISAVTNDGATTFYAVYPGGTSEKSYFIADVLKPQVAEDTQIFINGNFYNAGTQMRLTNGFFNATTQFDGFSIFNASGGNISGTLAVYGYRQA